MIKTPSFWWKRFSWHSLFLWPISFVYSVISAWIMNHGRRKDIPVPVLCVGNFVMGGAGKTPTSLTLAAAALDKGLKPGFLSRGYGRRLRSPVRVDFNVHGVHYVGDEPLILARTAVTIVADDREIGAALLVKECIDIIIMDDGFHTSQLRTDLSLVVVDSRRGLGNGFIFPAGPLRVPFTTQLLYTDIILYIRDVKAAAKDITLSRCENSGKPIHFAELNPSSEFNLSGSRVLAFAGIADPEKFFTSVKNLGAILVESFSFGDHASLKDKEIITLLTHTKQKELQLVTTAKDTARLKKRQGIAQELLSKVITVEVTTTFKDQTTPSQLIDMTLSSFKKRK